MINVVASIRIKEGMVDQFLEIFKDNVPIVRKEKGCIEYTPCIDINTNLAPQVTDKNIVTIIEKWETIEDLYAHIKAPHMATYREKAKDMTAGSSFKILTEA